MYFNINGESKIVKEEVVSEYLNRTRKGNIIYCLQIENNYFAVDERFKTEDELNSILSKYRLKGYIVHYHATKPKSDKRRSSKGKC